MIIYPAIDIKNGNVVRLIQGRFNDVTEYAKDPVAMARHWERLGAQWIHVIDLDGAQTGLVKNRPIISEMAQAVKVPLQVGGGIRTRDDIESYFSSGVRRIVLGTRAVSDREFLKGVLKEWPDGIAVSLDCLNGLVTKLGWTETTDLRAVDLAEELEDMGLKTLIYTDIHRDGMMTGPNLEALEELLEHVTCSVIASGGVKGVEDLTDLCRLEGKGLSGAITGKALYEGTLNFEKALALCSQNG